MNKRYLWVPIILCLALFFVDKLFGLQWVRQYTISWKKIEIIFYESKDELFEIFKENLPIHQKEGLKPGIILGSSRSGEFAPKDIQKEFPGIAPYNFSAPLAGPAFHYYWLKKVMSVSPDLGLVILEADPIMFSKSSLTYTLNYALDLSFVWENSDFFPERFSDPWVTEKKGFSWDEAETWFTKNLFMSYRYPPDPGAIKDNGKETFIQIDKTIIPVKGSAYKDKFKESVSEANRLAWGAVPNQIMHNADPKFLERDAKNMANTYFGQSFQPSATQIKFFEKILESLAERNIPVILYWPLVAEPLRIEMKERGLIEEYRKRIEELLGRIQNKYPDFQYEFLDPHEEKSLTCRAFVDSIHLSGACYPELFTFFRNSTIHH
jgi:hypothetical protein